LRGDKFTANKIMQIISSDAKAWGRLFHSHHAFPLFVLLSLKRIICSSLC